MMQNSKFSMIAGVLLALLLAGCGGGGESGQATAAGSTTSSAASSTGPVAMSTPAVLRVESRVQPAEAARQDVAQVKTLAARAAPPAARVTLDALSSEKAAAAVTPLSGARQVGAARGVEATATVDAMRSRLGWQATAAGGQVAAVSFAAADAKGVRLGVLVGQLPGSSMLRIYSQAAPDKLFEISGHEVLQSIDRNTAAGDTGAAAHTWWSPEFGSPEVTLEIELPPGTPADALQISVPTLSQMFVDLELPIGTAGSVAKDIGDAGSCERDATCDPQFANTANAVARMLFTKNGSSYLCTGTLLNDAASDGAPYFISANHCISTQTVASTLQTDWFYHAAACNVRALSGDYVRRLRGARLLYAASTTDTSFMLLNDAPPANAVFAGWDATAEPVGLAVTGLHHAAGDLLKISYGNLSSYASCSQISSDGSYTCNNGSSANGTDLRVVWTSGSTEGGSSGSGLFTRIGDGNYLIGTLRGGNTSCSNLNGADEYGRFDVAFQTALQQWLNAPSTGPGPAGRTAIYRFYNATTGAHFYTASAAERDYVIATYGVFRYEGTAFYAYPANFAGQSPVYRFYNPSTRAHFYTVSGPERDAVLSNPAYQYEGISWAAQVAPGNGSVPVYRFYNPARDTHFYTVNAGERNHVADTFGAYVFEGIGYYAWNAP